MAKPGEHFIQKVAEYEQSLTQKIFDLDGQLPYTLYHYTSSGGLIGILTSRAFWMTNVQYMNDSSELEYGQNLFRAAIQEEFSALSTKEEESELRKFLSRYSSPNYSVRPNISFEFFVTSFCEDGNLLNQWRSYGGQGGGYSLGFDFSFLLPGLSLPCTPAKVIYDPKIQQEAISSLLEQTIQKYSELDTLNIEEKLREDLARNLEETFLKLGTQIVIRSKHPAFETEQEWRLVLQAPMYASRVNQNQWDFTAMGFRSSGGDIIPYYSVNFEKAIAASLDDQSGIGFPMRDVVIGPTVDPELNQKSVSALLETLNSEFKNIVRVSGLPLRWL